jgi:hypothetical protein
MEKIVNRADITDPYYREILDIETHHAHAIIIDVHGVIRWKGDRGLRKCIENISLNDLIPMFICMGYDKNSEPYRQLYRDLGYSLSGYHEIFYWEANNPLAHEYKPNPSCIGIK